MFVAEALNLTKHAAKRLEEKNILREAFTPHSFFSDVIEAYRFDKKFGEIEEGTVVAKTINGVRVVRGFPKIRRALTLYPTLIKHFGNFVAVEEKMNGYNVRIVRFGKNIYAITRRGYICPYTTEVARELINADFFKEYPDYMLCCEAVGEESPYVPKDIYGIDRLDFFVFDIRHRETNKPIRIREKQRICEEFGLKYAEIFGIFETKKAHEEIKEIILRLGEVKREGVVIKDPDMAKEPMKYTTSETNAEDLRYAFRFFNDYGKDFMFSRIVREGFQSCEFNESEEEFRERCLRLGRAILEPMVESIKDVAEKKKVVERIRLRFKQLEVLNLFLEHLRKGGVNFEIREIKKEGKEIVLIIDRIMKSTTDKIRHHLNGNPW